MRPPKDRLQPRRPAKLCAVQCEHATHGDLVSEQQCFCRAGPMVQFFPLAGAWSRLEPDSSSTNAVTFSSARPTKRFPLPRCASAIQIVCPLESMAETQLQLHPALGIVDHLRRRFTRFELGAHFFDLGSLFFHRRGEGCDLFLQLRNSPPAGGSSPGFLCLNRKR
jgi:hypothetical protein